MRDEMLAEPELALRIVERARSAPRIRNRAAFAIAKWRNRRLLEPRAELEAELDQRVPPTLDSLEYVWSRRPTVVGGLILKLLAVALERHGGFGAMRAEFERHRPSSS